MNIFFSDHAELPLPDGHRFPMAKYRRTRDLVEAAGLGTVCPAEPVDRSALLLAHDPAYVMRVESGTLSRQEARRIGFPNGPALFHRARTSVGGTVCAARAACEDGIAAHLAGGTHHAHYDWGQGYCVFNDVVVAARCLQQSGRIRRAVVIDLDVHQGNGTAAITADDPSIFTFSMHAAKNFPFRKAQSDVDVPLTSGTGDEEYLATLEAALWRVLALAKADFAFYIAGADPYRGDRLGKLALSRDGLRRRDQFVIDSCRDARLPLAVVMGGGYADDIEAIAAIHLATVTVAAASAGS